MPKRHTPLILFLAMVLAILGFSGLGPVERTLGSNVRLVYLHGAWAWTSLIGFALAAATAALGLGLRREAAQRWSIAIGQASTFFWLAYLLLSLRAMQLNWNGLYLDEPRWRIGVDFAVMGVLLQAAAVMIKDRRIGSLLNILFFSILARALVRAEQVMHPPSPITSSGSIPIQLFFFGLSILCLLAAWQLASWLHQWSI